MMQRRTAVMAAILAVFLATSMYYAVLVSATPGGSSIIYNSTGTYADRTPGNRSDPRSTITTMILSVIQKDDFWKAYVGNITGRLSLESADGYMIYDWPISLASKSGEVYISRASSVAWYNVSCVNETSIYDEEGYIGMSTVQSDNINKTFNDTNNHGSFLIGNDLGSPTTISANSCRSTATYIDGAGVPQTLDGNHIFQEVLLQDNSNGLLIFASLINASQPGFDNRSYDFQAIVPDAGFYNTTSTTYYFYTELG
jgi:hypothetical protein